MDLKLRNNSQLALTDGYIPVEYIESSGYPNINTGVSFYAGSTSKSKIELDIEINSIETSTYIYYAYTNNRYTYLSYSGTNNIYNVKSAGASSSANTQVEIVGRSHIIHTLTNITINGSTTTITGQSTGSSYATIYLLNSANSPETIIHSCKLYDSSGTLVRDYIPVISYQEGHFGEACLYDKVNGVFYYSASTGSFTASANVYAKMITAYIKDCPNVSGIDLLRKAVNLQRIRCDVGNVSGTVAELLKYTILAGFTDDYQEQQIPRIVGTWTLNSWYTNEELENFQGAIDGLTVIGDGIHNVETALENGDFAVQTIDSTKPNYNPAAAIRLNANGYGHITTNRIINNGGKFIISKNDAVAITTLPLTLFRQVKTVTDDNSIVTDDSTLEYSFTTFNEFKYFTGITAITGNSSGGAFYYCDLLQTITLPTSITSIGTSALSACSSITSITIPNSVTSIASYGLAGMTSVVDLIFPKNSTCYNDSIHSSGNGNGILKVGVIRGTSNSVSHKFKYVYIYTKATGESNHPCFLGSSIYNIRLNGNFESTSNHSGNILLSNSTTNVRFIEIMGKFIGSYGFIAHGNGLHSGCIMHLGSDVVAGSTTRMSASHSKLSKIYVGDGSSRANDEAILALYLADTDWNAQSAKLATWYDYNGEYKWYYVTDNLTDCTNSNPDAWPHITRGEEYRTTIVADEGYTLDTVKVEMYSARDNALTPDEPTDITSAVYNASTGEIYIQEVVGNVIITANAS